ncbi:DUF6286 domain-containing protein [Corynebacterium pygosceleis]|uniref:DUF6286 domain-containing protein n=1 Tax=Corynebacterium pygosceleis TaxID=2800406 RepID=A0A9Q4GJI1_9CORY|nr:DUF6286 domain-containing protein [Corynebacterium pygosceleis]MCK7637502.1 DUF6286 domain-containing protein [Corynebacterium pygosceleis]MCK7674689.1 DUF6286 domain-containing protein [Corynebacterium pygosceleis]MCL0119722.1 DUF6286 domain-containing protein [Corynebacterium pygosceleis]MCX7444969.1 DUF6286 domain-containing protein [Corynebacterium pygosceleis]MCX7468169.1 DUF6286 domain-containing protein [Corynebacterium pygosceleis]
MSEIQTVRGHRPAASPVARYLAILLGLLLLAAAAVAGRDLYIRYTDVEWQPWVSTATEWIGGLSYRNWMLPAGIAALIVGLLLLWASIRPRTKTHRELTSPVAVWMRPVDVARMCTASAQQVPGVMAAHTVAKKRSIDVTVIGNPGDERLRDELHRSLQPLANLVAGSPALNVQVQKKEVSK